MHSPSPPWDTKPVKEHLACMTDCLSKARTVAGRLGLRTGVRLCANQDPVFARMGNDEQLCDLFTMGTDDFKGHANRFDKEIA